MIEQTVGSGTYVAADMLEKLPQAEEAYRLFDTQTTGKGVFMI